MNIALVIFRAQAERGGAERYVRDLSGALITRGHEVTILASRGEVIEGVTLSRIAAGGTTRIGRYRRFCRNLERHLTTSHYDVVHACLPVPRCHVYHAHAGLETLTLRDAHLRHASLPRQAIAKMFGGLNRKRRAFAAVEKALITSASPPLTLCLSNREREEAMLAFPSAKDRFITLYSFPDDSRFSLKDVKSLRKRMRKQLGLDDSNTMYIFVGNDFARKGLATAIRALGKMPDPRATLLVVGEGDTHHYTEMALQSGAMGRVMFVGKANNVRDFLAAADALVLPSRSEPFGMVVVEAMLMGVPPIVSAVAGASEIIDRERNGLVVDSPSDVEAWAAAMTRISDRAFRDHLSAACLEQRERFSYSHHLDALEAIYRKCKSRNIA